MRLLYTAIIILFLFNNIISQHIQSAFLKNGDEIHLDLLPENGLVYNHTIRKGHTVYSLAKYFQISEAEILRVNNLNSERSISINQTVYIPFDHRILFKGENLASIKYGLYIPVYYTVQAKDNLFRISKYLFDQPISSMMKRNKMEDYNLSLGQKLLVGWMPIDTDKIIVKPDDIGAISPNLPVKDTIGLYIKNELFNPDASIQKASRKLSKYKGIAIWDRNSSDKKNMFALHSSAQSNSIIEIYNPLLNRTAYATVVGQIPKQSYPEDVSLIISPKVAEALGALDTRFLVEVKFYQ
jgi:LysM repeat protein